MGGSVVGKARSGMLRIENVTKHFSGSPVLHNINLQIAQTCIVGLAGPSGSGKSTLLRAIQGLETLDEGRIVFEGKRGFMFQDFQLFPHMTVLENLIYAPRLHDPHTDPRPRAQDLLKALGIEDKASAYPHHLSGGQKQRVALSRSLMMNPQLLLCDEPTSGLDVATIEDVVGLLNQVHDMGVMMIIASHDLDFLTRMAGRIVLLKQGQVVCDVQTATLADPIHHLKPYYGER